jgi:hypothetical protein
MIVSDGALLTSLHSIARKLPFLIENIIFFFTKQGTLIRKSMALCLPLQLLPHQWFIFPKILKILAKCLLAKCCMANHRNIVYNDGCLAIERRTVTICQSASGLMTIRVN